jgi:hypothetical protein
MDRAEPRRVRKTCHAIVIVVALAFVVGHAYDIATSAEHWPWSPYRMYSSAKAAKHTELHLWGVRADKTRRGRPAEFRMKGKGNGYVVPIARFKKLYAKGTPANRQQTELALVKYRDYYERERAAGKAKGPPLLGVRLYQVTWSLGASAKKGKAPDVRELVVETPMAKRPATTRPTTSATTQSMIEGRS